MHTKLYIILKIKHDLDFIEDYKNIDIKKLYKKLILEFIQNIFKLCTEPTFMKPELFFGSGLTKICTNCGKQNSYCPIPQITMIKTIWNSLTCNEKELFLKEEKTIWAAIKDKQLILKPEPETYTELLEDYVFDSSEESSDESSDEFSDEFSDECDESVHYCQSCFCYNCRCSKVSNNNKAYSKYNRSKMTSQYRGNYTGLFQ